MTITDTHNCTDVSTVFVSEPPLLNASIPVSTNVLCFGGNNGSAITNVSGGTAPYAYVWSPSGGTASSASGLIAGNYSVSVTDAQGCNTSVPVAIVEPALLDASTNITSSTCSNSNGAAASVVNGGTLPYNYSWSPGGAITASINAIPAGTYTVTVTDGNGCVSTSTATVTNIGSPNANVTAVSDVSCFGGSDGTASVSVSGGTPPFAYAWSPSGGTTTNASGLSSGVYTLFITDGNNCITPISTTINQPPQLIAAVPLSSAVSCFGGNNGTALASAAGGTGPYTYSWSPSGGTNASASGLVTGNYIVTVTDAHNCTNVSNVFIPQPPVLNASIPVSTNVLCFGGNNGAATANVSGGTSPYTYAWSPSGGTAVSASGLIAGNYSVTVTDALGCTTSDQVIILQPVLLDVSTNITSSTCNFSNGAAASVVIGGTPPYNYSWSPGGAITPTLSAIPAGVYTVTVTDGNGCASTSTATVTNIGAPTANVTSLTDVTCFGGSDGSVSVSVSGGVPPFLYSWSPSGGTTTSASGLSSGNYILNITDGNNCVTPVPTTINQPTLLTAAVPVTSAVSCFGGNNGSALASAAGGSPPYQYAWSPSGGINSSASGLSAGNYSVSVTDSHGCTTSSTTSIIQPDSMILNTASLPVTCFGLSTGSANIAVGSGGTSPYSYSWSPGGGTNTVASNLPAGNYTIAVTDGNGCIQYENIAVSEPAQVVLNATSHDVLCFGDVNGTATAAGIGGVPPYSYVWPSLGINTSTVNNLAVGVYAVTMTDNNGCPASSSVTIGEPSPLNLVTAGSATICNGQTVILTATVTGGVGGYVYQWSNGATISSPSVSPSLTTNYTVNVADSNGCTVPAQMLTVSVGPPLISQATTANPICPGDTTTISSSASGGNGGPYEYVWSTGAHSQTIQVSPFVTTTYYVTVSDNCGTSPSTSATIVTVYPPPLVSFLPNPVTGCEPLTANFSDGSTTSPGSHYFWDFGDGSSSIQQNPTHVYPHAGTYSVSLYVRSFEGCKSSLLAPDAVVVYPLPSALFTTDQEIASVFHPVITFNDNSTLADIWEWDLGDNSGIYNDQNITHTYPDTGSYLIRLITTTNFGCKDTTYGRITIEGEFAMYIPNAFTPDGNGTNDNFIPSGIGVRKFDMYIFNRWGTNIFHSTSMNHPWDGKVQGSEDPCQNDVYVYKIYVKDIKEKMHTYIGHVTLVR